MAQCGSGKDGSPYADSGTEVLVFVWDPRRGVPAAQVGTSVPDRFGEYLGVEVVVHVVLRHGGGVYLLNHILLVDSVLSIALSFALVM